MRILSGPVSLPHRGKHSVKGIGSGLKASLGMNLPRREAALGFTSQNGPLSSARPFYVRTFGRSRGRR